MRCLWIKIAKFRNRLRVPSLCDSKEKFSALQQESEYPDLFVGSAQSCTCGSELSVDGESDALPIDQCYKVQNEYVCG